MAGGAHLGGSGKRGAIPAHLRRRKPGRRGGRAASRGTAGPGPSRLRAALRRDTALAARGSAADRTETSGVNGQVSLASRLLKDRGLSLSLQPH